MTLALEYERIGISGAEYTVAPTGAKFLETLPPVILRIVQGGHSWQDHLTAKEARRLAYALIEEANKAENPHLRGLREAVARLPEVS